MQYPLVEAGTGAVFAVIAFAPIALPFKILALPIAALLIAIAVYDLYTTIIPDRWAAISGTLCLIAAILGALSSGSPLMPALLAGPVAALPLFALWYLSKGKWMGLGDAKLTLSTGWLLGVQGGLTAVFLAFIIGTIVSIPLMFLSSKLYVRLKEILSGSPHGGVKDDSLTGRGLTMKSEVPFGPYLVASCFIVWFAQMYAIPLPFPLL